MSKETGRAVWDRLLNKGVDWAFMVVLVGGVTAVFEPARDFVISYLYLPATVESMQSELEHLSDEFDSQRRNGTEVVIWAQGRSQALTEAQGPCKRGTTCTAFFRGRRTIEGIDCVFQSGRPYLDVGDDRIPLNFAPEYQPVNLGFDFETLPVMFEMPLFAPPGRAGILVFTVYSDCPFASDGELVERDTIILSIIIE